MRVRVAVLAGGVSTERTISLETARAILAGLPADRYEAIPVEVTAAGGWAVAGGPPEFPESAAARLRSLGVDVVFPGLHGRFGEDGVVQGFLETIGFPCVGAGVAASALAMDKARTRDVAAAHGVPLAPAVEIRWDDSPENWRPRVAALGLPAVVKDPTGGSSIGVTIARSSAERDAATAALLDGVGRALVEAHVAGLELTCAVLGNTARGGAVRALPPILIRPKRGAGWFDYETKYDPDAVDELCPAPVDPALSAAVADCAVRMHRAIGAAGITRSDFMAPEGGPPVFLEINTLPGLTPASLVPKAAAAAGLPFPELLAKLVEEARACATDQRKGR